MQKNILFSLLMLLFHQIILYVQESFRKNIKTNHANWFQIEIKIYNTILTEKQQKYQDYHQKSDKYGYLTGEEIMPSK